MLCDLPIYESHSSDPLKLGCELSFLVVHEQCWLFTTVSQEPSEEVTKEIGFPISLQIYFHPFQIFSKTNTPQCFLCFFELLSYRPCNTHLNT